MKTPFPATGSPDASTQAPDALPGPRPRSRTGRPRSVSAADVLVAIRRLAAEDRLFRVHHEDPALYARARRDHGSWAAALSAAGLDPREAVARARRRAREGRTATRPNPPNTHE